MLLVVRVSFFSKPFITITISNGKRCSMNIHVAFMLHLSFEVYDKCRINNTVFLLILKLYKI